MTPLSDPVRVDIPERTPVQPVAPLDLPVDIPSDREDETLPIEIRARAGELVRGH